MEEALSACRGIFSRFAVREDSETFISLPNVGVIVLALERHFVEDELRAILWQLAARPDGALNLVGLCEVVSYAMKGAPHTHDALMLTSPSGVSHVVSLSDVAAANLKALYTMHPTFDEQRCWLNTEAALAEHCVADGDGLDFAMTHVPASFAVRAHDWVHRPCESGGELFEVRMRGPVGLQADVTDRGDGTYLVGYTPTISGSYVVHVTLNRVAIKGSPFTLTVDSDQTRPENCHVEGSGLSGSEAGKAASFTIYKRDRHGHARTRGVDHFYADVQGPGKWECRIRDERDGSYVVTYTAKAAGTYRLDIGLAPNVGPIAHSPFTIVVKPAAPDPRTTTLVAPPPSTVLCGRPFVLQLVARDRWGNLCAQERLGGEEAPSAWVAADQNPAEKQPKGGMTGANREAATVEMLEPGKYALSLTPVTQGKNTVHVCWAGMNVKGSPFTLKALPAPPHASSYKLTSKPKSWPTLPAGARFKVRLQAHDRFGNVYSMAGCPRPLVWLRPAERPSSRSVSPERVRSSSHSSHTPSARALPPPPLMTPLAPPPSTGGAGHGGERGSDKKLMMSLPHGVARSLSARLQAKLQDELGEVTDEWRAMIEEIEAMQAQVPASPNGKPPRGADRSGARDGGGGSGRTPGKEPPTPLLRRHEDGAAEGSLAFAPSPALVTALGPRSSAAGTGGNAEGAYHAEGGGAEDARVHCEVLELGHGVYELSGTPLKAGHYHMCIRLAPLAPSASDPAGRGGAAGPAGRVTAANAPDVGHASEASVVETVEHPAALAISVEEAEGALGVVKIVAGATWPPACELHGDGLFVGYEGDESCYDVVAYDRHGNVASSGGERYELRAHKLLPGGTRRLTPLEHCVDDHKDGTYTVRYTPHEAGRWELCLYHRGMAAAEATPTSPSRKASGSSGAATGAAGSSASEMATVVGGRSFMVAVRPALAKHLSTEEANAAMEAHARAETALACECYGSGLLPCTAGDMRTLTVRMPPRPLRSPPCRVIRNERGEDVVAGGQQARLGSWSLAEHTVLDQAQLAVTASVERLPGCGQQAVPSPFALNEVRDNGDGSWYIAYTVICAGTMHLNVELQGGGHIAGSPFAIPVATGELIPQHATIEGAGLRDADTGVATAVDIFARDHMNNALPYDAATYDVRIVRTSRRVPVPKKSTVVLAAGGTPAAGAPPAGAAALSSEVAPVSEVEASSGDDATSGAASIVEVELVCGPDGGCRAHFTLLEPGTYALHASTGGVPVAGSPFHLSCGAGPVDLSCCTLLEVGIGGEPLQRVASIGGGRLWLQTRDGLANARTTPSSQPLTCELREIGGAPPAHTPCAVADLGDGRIEVTYPPTTPTGLHAVVIGFAPAADDGSAPRRAPSASGATEHCVGRLRMDAAIRFGDEALVSTPSVLRVKPGVLFDVLVSAVDEAGRQAARGGEALKAQLSSGPAPVALEVFDTGGGAYRVATAVQVSGEYRIAFSLNGLPVAGSPITLIAPRATSRPPTASAGSSVASVRTSSPRRPGSPRGAPAVSAMPRATSPRGGAAARASSPRSARPTVTPLSQPKLPPTGAAANKPQRSPRSPRSVASPR